MKCLWSFPKKKTNMDTFEKFTTIMSKRKCRKNPEQIQKNSQIMSVGPQIGPNSKYLTPQDISLRVIIY